MFLKERYFLEMLHYIIRLHTDGGRRKGTDDGTKRDRQTEKEEKEKKRKGKEKREKKNGVSSFRAFLVVGNPCPRIHYPS